MNDHNQRAIEAVNAALAANIEDFTEKKDREFFARHCPDIKIFHVSCFSRETCGMKFASGKKRFWTIRVSVTSWPSRGVKARLWEACVMIVRAALAEHFDEYGEAYAIEAGAPN